MAKLTKAPPLNPVKSLPTASPPATSKTQDNYTHHTSPNKGPQPRAKEATANIPAKPGAKIKRLPDAPMHKTKHDKDA